MNILVIGATGFIGAHLVERLLHGGHSISALVRSPKNASHLNKLGVKLHRGDVTDENTVLHAAKGVEVIYNLAGSSESILSRQDPYGDRIFEANALGNLYAAKAALSAGARRLVTVSSIFIFGHSPGKPVDEEHVTNLWHYAGPYLFSRMQQELHVLRHALRGLEAVIVNPGFIVGAKDRGPNFPGQIIVNLLNRRFPFYPPGGTSWIGVRDVVDGLVAAATRGRSGERYIFTSEDLTFKELGKRIQKLTGVPAPKRMIPKTVLKRGAALGKFVMPLLGQRASIDPTVAVRLVTDGFYYSPAKAKKELGLPCRHIDDDLLAACEDFRQRGLAHY